MTDSNLPATDIPTTDLPTIDARANPPAADTRGPARPPARRHVKLGWALLLLAVVLWAPLPVIPFLSLPASVKVSLAAGLFAAVQIAWWGGTALAGPTAARQLYAWFKRKLGRGNEANEAIPNTVTPQPPEVD